MPESTVRTERLLESLTNMHHVFRCLPPTGVINKGEFMFCSMFSSRWTERV